MGCPGDALDRGWRHWSQNAKRLTPDTLTFETKADASIHWVYRNGTEAGAPDLLSQALRKIDLPKGDYHAWVACESSAAKALRSQLLGEHGAQAQWTRAAGYWRRGVADVHDNLTD